MHLDQGRGSAGGRDASVDKNTGFLQRPKERTLVLGLGTEPVKAVSKLRDHTTDIAENDVDASREEPLGTLEGREETAATANRHVLPAARQDAHIRIRTEPAVTMSE